MPKRALAQLSPTTNIKVKGWTLSLIMVLDLFLVCFFLYFFLFVPCVGLSWLHVSFLLHVKYTVSHRIVSYFYGAAYVSHTRDCSSALHVYKLGSS